MSAIRRNPRPTTKHALAHAARAVLLLRTLPQEAISQVYRSYPLVCPGLQWQIDRDKFEYMWTAIV